MGVSYPKSMRERAKQDGKTLASFDSETNGCRFTYQGPATEAQARFTRWCSVAAVALSERQLNEIRRDLKAKIERATKRRRKAKGGE